MIYGVTHDKRGEPRQRLTIAHKVSIGLPPGEDSNYPKRLDYFQVVAKSGKGEWVEDAELSKKLLEKYGRQNKLREFDIVLLSNDIDQVFHTEYAWWSKTERKCHGNGLEAERRESAISEGGGSAFVKWEPCGRECPQLKQRQCKPSGDLYFMFADRPVIGSCALYHTSGYESVMRLNSSLHSIQAITGGRLFGIRLRLCMRPYRTRYNDNGTIRTSVQYAVNLEFREEDYAKIIPSLIEQSMQHQYALQAASTPRQIAAPVEVEALDEEDAAAYIHPEFYPEEQPSTAETMAEDAGTREANGIDHEVIRPEDESKLRKTYEIYDLGPKKATDKLLEIQAAVLEKGGGNPEWAQQAVAQEIIRVKDAYHDQAEKRKRSRRRKPSASEQAAAPPDEPPKAVNGKPTEEAPKDAKDTNPEETPAEKKEDLGVSQADAAQAPSNSAQGSLGEDW